ncbi:MAG: methylmalonyl-CoA mutase, partial [Thermicanus sp.]|nr:methylmalonyl-CoA mutase [Thermicanus sp.]
MERDYAKEKEDWRRKTEVLLNKYPERKKEFKTLSGIPIDRVYYPDHITDEYMEKLGFPGE